MSQSIPPLPATFDAATEFPILNEWTFLNHAAVAPISARAAAALDKYTREATHDAYLTGQWYNLADETRARAARLMNSTPDEIAFVKNTSEGLAFVANGWDWKAGDEIIGTNVEYPANVYPWMDLERRGGLKYIMVPEKDGRIEIDALLGSVTAKTRMIALSHVEYASGFRNDLHAIGAFCRARGILLCVDAIQSLGVLPVDVRAMNIDFLSADGHKWLLSPEGCGVFFCRKELIQELRPEIGWLNVINAQDYGHYDLTLRDDAKRFECGSYNIPGILALNASLKLIEEIGIDLISRRVLALTDVLVEGLKRKGYAVVSSRREGESSGIVSFTSSTRDHKELNRELMRKKIVLALREGRLRASPHFYNSVEQIERVIEELPES
ncbi:MAG TPA: aminotransferase class V-fold PLP-dependent enzyme [Planctomycetota bacterium]|nr:aminotransferase class V-fold PLP-dependent enzyme [Planctomycetota bacterium]